MENAINVLIAIATLVVPGIVLGVLIVLLGVKTSEKRRVKKKKKEPESTLRAFVKCCGGEQSVKRYTYSDTSDCSSAHLLAGGPTECRFSCLGLGTCVAVCEMGAISISDGIAVADEEKCNGCGKCAVACPRGIIELIPMNAEIKVRCASLHPEKDIFTICNAGCIGCGACEKTCKYDAIKVLQNVAHIDYEKCTACGECAKICPQNVILSPAGKEEFDENEYFELGDVSEETEVASE